MLDLKNCPFCGGEATHRRFTGNGFTLARVEYTQVSCQKCRIETEPDQPLGNEDRAATAWNRRTLQAVGPEPAVAVKPLEWRDLREHTFPPMWSASTVCGVYDIEERCASDTPAYVVLGPLFSFIADKDSLVEAKAAAEADYEHRILSALRWRHV